MRINLLTRQSGQRVFLGAATALWLGACSAQYSNHGYVPPAHDLDDITLGLDTRDSVQEALGSAAASGVQTDRALYYVRTRIRSVGLLAPSVSEREVLAISFDTAGTVSNIETFGLEDGQVVPLSRRVTSSGVQDKTFLRQLLGNVGRFNPAAFGS
jgi:outer membrane protein assembly factor BamE (lipoprotein component of BamABCDE complex)